MVLQWKLIGLYCFSIFVILLTSLYLFLRAAILIYHKLAENNRNFFSYSSGGQKSEMKVLAGSAFSEGSGKNLFHAFSELLVFPLILGVPWLVDASSLQSLLPSSHGHLPCVCLSVFLLFL